MVLPRISDATADALEMMSHLEPGQEVEFLVLDFVAAFWNVPLRHSERRFFAGKIADKFLTFLRPKMARCLGQPWSLSEQPSGTPPKAREALRLQTFVDDSLFCIRESQQARAIKMALMVLVWRALVFPLAFQKETRGSSVPWIGCVLKIDVLLHQVTAEIAEEKVVEAKDRVEQILRSNVVSDKKLRSILGLLNHLASFIFPLRAFLSPTCAALSDSAEAQSCPSSCVWVKQIRHALLWIKAFLDLEPKNSCACSY